MYLILSFSMQHDLLNSESFTKVYQIFNDENSIDNTGKEYCEKIKEKLSIPKDDKDLILHFCNNLYKIIADYNNWNNVHF